MSVKFQLITPKDIIEAFEAHGNNFVVIDLEGRKKCPTVEYIKINFKLANNCIISPGLKVKELKTSGQIPSPDDRQYEVTQLSFKLNDKETGETVEAVDALRLVFEAIETQIDAMVDSGMITASAKSKKKVKDADGNDITPIVLPSVTLMVPYSTTYLDKKTGECTEKEPSVSVRLPFKFGLKKEECEQFGDLCYKDSEVKFLIKPYDTIFYDATSGYYNRSKKPVFKLLGEEQENGSIKIDNTNIQEYIPRNSIIKAGTIRFNCNASKFGLSVKAEFTKAMYIEKGVYEAMSAFDDDELDEICASSMKKVTVKDDDEDDITFDDE